jgi:hypothetical protein
MVAAIEETEEQKEREVKENYCDTDSGACIS